MPVMDWLAPTLMSTAFLAGLLGSGHCFGMCGGIAAGLGAMAPGKAMMPAIQFNFARLASYMVLGGVSASMLGVLTKYIHIGLWLRLLTAVMIFMIGLRFLFNFSGLEWIERGGSVIWKKIMPVALKAGGREDWMGRVLLGACWGVLPCGLVYSLLITAASTANAVTGAVIMLAFGVGTLPAMLGLTMASPALNTMLQDKTVRKLIGFALILLAFWTVIMVWAGLQNDIHNHLVSP